jgi:hypothetical protein
VGVCFGCSLRCHLDHNVIELFEKRNFRSFSLSSSLLLSLFSPTHRFFRCDCGVRTPMDCSFATSPRSPTSTSRNRYNANFLNKYCWCGRPYDTSAEAPAKGSDAVTPSGTTTSVTCSTDNVMRQCYFCQDWFHEDCIEERAKEWRRRRDREGEREGERERVVEHVAIDGDVCGSYVCVECAKRGRFLMDGYGLIVNPLVWLTEEEEEVAVAEECPLTLPTDKHSDTHKPSTACTRHFTLPISSVLSPSLFLAFAFSLRRYFFSFFLFSFFLFSLSFSDSCLSSARRCPSTRAPSHMCGRVMCAKRNSVRMKPFGFTVWIVMILTSAFYATLARPTHIHRRTSSK